MRLFLAVEPDRPAAAAIGRRLTGVQAALGDAAAALRWTPTQNIHVTLHFLGEVDQARRERLIEALGPSIALAPFDVRFGPLEVFPIDGPPRVLWIALGAPSPGLTALHAQIGERVAGAGWTIEARPFTPHLTLARVPDRERRRIGRLRETLAAPADVPIAWTVERVTLFRSDLSGPVPRYEPIHEIALKLV